MVEEIQNFIEIQQLQAQAYTIPTETPEADGTLQWNSTTIVVVTIKAGSATGLGYTYANPVTAGFINKKLKGLVIGQNAFDIPRLYDDMVKNIRNSGNCGISMMAISAVDNALWDLKARLLNLPLCKLLGSKKNEMLLYGSGGFTNYSRQQLQQQLGGWAQEGFKYVKMKIGADPNHDLQRIAEAREAVGETKLMVDANGAYSVKQALKMAADFEHLKVMWFEEPVSSDNLEGLRFIRQHVPPQVNVAAGEYGYNLYYFKAMLQANAVDIVQADATRCGGITGFLQAGCLAEAFQLPFSSHCAPALHLHAALALKAFFIAEYFFDHARIEHMLFDGVPKPINGFMQPDLSRPGIGLEFKWKDAEQFLV